MTDQNPSPEENDPVADAFAELAAEESASTENAEPSGEAAQPPQGDTPEAQAPEASAAPAVETDAATDDVQTDDAAAMVDALLADVGAAVNDVNSGIMGADADPLADATASVQPSPQTQNQAQAQAQTQPQTQAPPPIPDGASPLDLPTFDQAVDKPIPAELDMLADVNLNVKIELGRTSMLVEDVLELSDGAVVELDKLAGDPVDIYVNERRIARGEVLVLNDTFCVRINEIIDAEDIKTS